MLGVQTGVAAVVAFVNNPWSDGAASANEAGIVAKPGKVVLDIWFVAITVKDGLLGNTEALLGSRPVPLLATSGLLKGDEDAIAWDDDSKVRVYMMIGGPPVFVVSSSGVVRSVDVEIMSLDEKTECVGLLKEYVRLTGVL